MTCVTSCLKRVRSTGQATQRSPSDWHSIPRIYICSAIFKAQTCLASRSTGCKFPADRYCKQGDYPYKTLYAAPPGYRCNCPGLRLLPQSRPRSPMSATVSRAGSTRNKLFWAQPLSSLLSATVAIVQDMSPFPIASIHAGDGCAPSPVLRLVSCGQSGSSAFLMSLISSTVAKPLYKP